MTWPRWGARRRALLGRVLLVLALVAPLAGGAAPSPAFAFSASAERLPTAHADAALPTWDGSINLYRTGVFTTQKTWYYCTAADVQIIRNIVRHEEDHSRASQDRYFAYMRQHLRYRIPVKHGVDPAGWTAGMRRFVDDRYRLVRSETFRSLIRSAVRSLRRTNLPVALFVDHGNHGWVLHGFTATADPAATSDFKVTSVRVTGPLWGRQNAAYGYDMKPNKKLSRAQLSDFVTRWHYAPIRMVYEGEFLSIQPIGAAATATTATALEAMPGSAKTATALEATPGPTAPPTPAQVAMTASMVDTGPPERPEQPSSQTLAILASGAGLALILVLRRRWSARRT